MRGGECGHGVAEQTWTYIGGHVGEQQLQGFVNECEEPIQHHFVNVFHVVQPDLR